MYDYSKSDPSKLNRDPNFYPDVDLVYLTLIPSRATSVVLDPTTTLVRLTYGPLFCLYRKSIKETLPDEFF